MDTPKNLLNNSSYKQLPRQPIFNSAPANPNNPNNPNKPNNFNNQDKNSKFNRKNILIFAGLLLVIVIVWFAVARKKESPAEVNSTLNNETLSTENDKSLNLSSGQKIKAEPVAVSGSNAIQANDQIAGDTVEVTMITLSVPGWVAIHEDKNGQLGNILGASRFDPGIHLGS
jgi:hypothetical protein